MMPKLTIVAVSLKLPLLGDINGTCEPDEAEQLAAEHNEAVDHMLFYLRR